MMIWLSFFVAILATVFILYAPGFLLMKAARQTSINALAFAPPLTLAIYAIVEIVLSKAGVPGNWYTIFLPFLIVAILLFIFSICMRHKEKRSIRCALTNLSDTFPYWMMVVLYVAVGSVVSLIVFIRHMHGPNSYTQLYDNAWHMGIIQKFLASGDFSTLNAGDIVATSGSTFYPTGWHSLVALVASMTGFSVPVCINASIFVILSIVYPISMFVLVGKLSAYNNNVIVAGAFTALMFAAFPWRFLTFGPLYSNLLSFSIIPLVITVALNMVEAKRGVKERIFLVSVFVLSTIGVAVTQPNAVFTMGLLVAPYIFLQIPGYLEYAGITKHRNIAVAGACVALMMAIAGVWSLIYNAKFMQRTVTWQWPSYEKKIQAFIDIAFVGFRNAEPQILLGVLVLIGMVYTVFHKRLLWITCGYIIMCGFYAVSSSTEGFLKNVLTGFWYHDQYRLGASAVFYGAVLAAMGLWNLMIVIVRLVPENLIGASNSRNKCILSTFCVLLIVLVNYFPSFYLSGRGDYVTAFGAITRDISYWNSPSEPKSYTATEAAFVEKVKKVVPKEAIILNQPYDGSAYAWGQNGLNVYYKAWEGNWMGAPSEDNSLISESLDKIASNREVKEAVRRVGAKYLLVLDKSDFSKDKNDVSMMKSIYASYPERKWSGIDEVSDATEGFKVVLSQGAMRLYRITV